MNRAMAHQAWTDAKRVLCVRLDALGDVLMTTPAMRALKESLPGRHITLLTSPGGAAIARMVPEIDEILAYDAPWVKATGGRVGSRPDHAMVERLREGGFDAAVVFTVYSQNPLPAAVLCYLADIPRRLAHCRENPYQLLTEWIPDPEPATVVRHEVRRQLDLVAAVGASTRDERLSLRVAPPVLTDVRARLVATGVDPDGRFVVIHPGATAPSRRYPPEGFAAAARQLALEGDCPIVFTGSADERDLVEDIRREMGLPSVSLAGKLALEAMAALLAMTPVLVSNNTGPVHMAAALGTPVVVLYALTNPQHAPWGVPSRVLFQDVPCRYCYKSVCPQAHHGCLRGVRPEAVARAAIELMDGGGDRAIDGDLRGLPRMVPPKAVLPHIPIFDGPGFRPDVLD